MKCSASSLMFGLAACSLLVAAGILYFSELGDADGKAGLALAAFLFIGGALLGRFVRSWPRLVAGLIVLVWAAARLQEVQVEAQRERTPAPSLNEVFWRLYLTVHPPPDLPIAEILTQVVLLIAGIVGAGFVLGRVLRPSTRTIAGRDSGCTPSMAVRESR